MVDPRDAEVSAQMTSLAAPYEARIREIASALEARDRLEQTLFEAIKHGDDEHRVWLQEAIRCHFAGEQVPAPQGSGSKDRLIADLVAMLEESAKAISHMADWIRHRQTKAEWFALAGRVRDIIARAAAMQRGGK